MFTKALISAAFLATQSLAALTHQPLTRAQADEKFPKMAKLFGEGGEHENYDYLAYELDSGDPVYRRVLFRIVGNKTSPGFRPKKQPVYIVNGAFTNTAMWLENYNSDSRL